MKTIAVSARVTATGCRITVDGKPYDISYPAPVWSSFPPFLRQQLADHVAYFFTHHLALEGNTPVSYRFPPPSARSLFFHGYIASLVGSTVELPKSKVSSVAFLKKAYHAEYRETFLGQPYPVTTISPHTIQGKHLIVPFSFGKDSLVTYALSKELGLEPSLYFFEEPTSIHENVNKGKLRRAFEKHCGTAIHRIPLSIGKLRESKNLLWGWDMLLTQYTLLLLPYVMVEHPRFLAWSNEQSTNDLVLDRDGYLVNPTHEQSVGWTLTLTNLLRLFGADTNVVSFLEPVHELAVMYILHRRYPEIGAFQLSCFNDHPKSSRQRWCGNCYECARVYVFLLAVGVSPECVGFVDNMLAMGKRHLQHPLSQKTWGSDKEWLSEYGEWILAFDLAARRGAKGPLIDLFRSEYQPIAARARATLIDKFLSLYPPISAPADVMARIFAIYRKEIGAFRREISANPKVPVYRS